MSQPDPTNYLDEHLYNELRWLLCAAAEWYVQDAINLDIQGYYVQVYAMDSAALHARALFEFFTKPRGAIISVSISVACNRFHRSATPVIGKARCTPT